MHKIIALLLICISVTACSSDKKPPLQPSQVVNGRSIVVPPEFHTIPLRPNTVTMPEQPVE